MKSKEVELLKSKVNGIIADKETLIYYMGASFCAVYLTLGTVFAMAEKLLFAGLSFTGFFVSIIGIKFLDFEYEMEKPKPIKEESDPDTEDGTIKVLC
jgi:mannose/fructose/N-acetylgalactosamine-specific phosphotransferase system component IIC